MVSKYQKKPTLKVIKNADRWKYLKYGYKYINPYTK